MGTERHAIILSRSQSQKYADYFSTGLPCNQTYQIFVWLVQICKISSPAGALNVMQLFCLADNRRNTQTISQRVIHVIKPIKYLFDLYRFVRFLPRHGH